MSTAAGVIERCNDAYARGLTPPPDITTDQWADEHRVLPRTSSEPGQYHTSRTPYLREIMQRLSSLDPCEEVVIMKGAQLGFSAVAENWVGHAIHHDPSPILLVQPTWSVAREYARDRILPLVTQTPALAALVHTKRSRQGGTTATRKEFPGGFLVITGANSAAELRAKSIRRLILDEVDGYPPDVDGEGDPVALAKKRTATFSNRKVLVFSTPTIKGSSRIEAEYEGTLDQQRAGYSPTDQRRYFVPCPRCGVFQTLEWENVRWSQLGRAPQDAAYVCPHCSGVIENHEKTWMLAEGEWRATAECTNPKVIGYRISGLYRPHGWRSWGEIATDWVKAKRAKDTSLLRTLVNTDLGQTWDVTDGQTIDPSSLLGRVEPASDTCSADVLVVTAGVDVQGDRLEVEIVGWGSDEESWSLDYRVIRGDPEQSAVWDLLDELLLRPIAHPRAPNGAYVSACCVDASFKTQRVCDYTRARRTRRVFAVKGVANTEATPRPIWNIRPGKPEKGKYDLYVVGVDTAKEILHARLAIDVPGPGYCHFSKPHNDEVYFWQLTAEKLRTKYHNGRAVYFWWKPENRRNEALDCRVYAHAALKSLLAMGMRLAERPRGVAAASDGDGHAPKPPPPRAPAPAPQPRRPSIWAPRRPRPGW